MQEILLIEDFTPLAVSMTEVIEHRSGLSVVHCPNLILALKGIDAAYASADDPFYRAIIAPLRVIYSEDDKTTPGEQLVTELKDKRGMSPAVIALISSQVMMRSRAELLGVSFLNRRDHDHMDQVRNFVSATLSV